MSTLKRFNPLLGAFLLLTALYAPLPARAAPTFLHEKLIDLEKESVSGNFILKGPEEGVSYSHIYAIEVGVQQLAVAARTSNMRTNEYFYVVDIWEVEFKKDLSGYFALDQNEHKTLTLKFKKNVYKDKAGDSFPIPRVVWHKGRLLQIGYGLSLLSASYDEDTIEIESLLDPYKLFVYREHKEIDQQSVKIARGGKPTALALNKEWMIIGYDNGAARIHHRQTKATTVYAFDGPVYSILNIALDSQNGLILITSQGAVFRCLPRVEDGKVKIEQPATVFLQDEGKSDSNSTHSSRRKFELMSLGLSTEGGLLVVGRGFDSLNLLTLQMGIGKNKKGGSPIRSSLDFPSHFANDFKVLFDPAAVDPFLNESKGLHISASESSIPEGRVEQNSQQAQLHPLNTEEQAHEIESKHQLTEQSLQQLQKEQRETLEELKNAREEVSVQLSINQQLEQENKNLNDALFQTNTAKERLAENLLNVEGQLRAAEAALQQAQQELKAHQVPIDPVHLTPLEDKGVALSCGHVFLKTTLEQQRLNHEDVCPYCQTKVTFNSAIKLFLEYGDK